MVVELSFLASSCFCVHFFLLISELLQRMTIKYKPKSVQWLISYSGLDMVVKKIIQASDLSVSRHVCELLTFILQDRHSAKFRTALAQADMLGRSTLTGYLI